MFTVQLMENYWVILPILQVCYELWGWMQSMVGKTDWDLKVEFRDLDKTATDTTTKLHNSTVCTMLWTGGM